DIRAGFFITWKPAWPSSALLKSPAMARSIRVQNITSASALNATGNPSGATLIRRDGFSISLASKGQKRTTTCRTALSATSGGPSQIDSSALSATARPKSRRLLKTKAILFGDHNQQERHP